MNPNTIPIPKNHKPRSKSSRLPRAIRQELLGLFGPEDKESVLAAMTGTHGFPLLSPFILPLDLLRVT